VCDFIEQHQEHIHEVALVGGEPLLLPENDRLLDVIPASAIVTLITNLNVDLENNKIFKKLATRKQVGWSMSFDNVSSRFEYVRHGGDWELLKRNLATVKDLMITQGQWGGIHAVYNIYNATRVCELREFAEEQGVTVLWQNLFQPEYLDPFLHNGQLAELAAAEIERFYSLGITRDTDRNFFDQALQTYQGKIGSTSAVTTKFRQHIVDNETQYHTDKAGQFVELWPELKFLVDTRK
jgi:MoaA/NifB/PqqE/SkfB family radical SAM enzyme